MGLDPKTRAMRISSSAIRQSRRTIVRRAQFSACLRAITMLALSLSLVSHGFSQSGRNRNSRSPDADDAVHLRVEEILLQINVRSDSGKLPDHLSPSDLILAEDKARHPVTALMRSAANILIIMDNCIEFGKYKRVDLNRDAAFAVIDSLGQGDKAAVISYGDKVELLSNWTTDKKALRLAITETYKPRVKSHLYESLIYGADELLQKVSGRRSVVLLSDGYDSYTKANLDKARVALDRARATVYVVAQSSLILKDLKRLAFSHSPNVALNAGTDPKYREFIANLRRYCTIVESEVATLKALAEDSGGAFWDPTTDEFKNVSDQVISEIGSEYVVAYSTERSSKDQEFHSLNVYSSRVGLKVRARHGVYSAVPSDAADKKR
jgi:Ca-activated chloride channel family protein